MRPWPVLLLVACSRPNPLFLDGEAGALTEMSSGTGSSGPATTEAPTGSGSSSSTTTEDTSDATSAPPWPACAPFPAERIAIDPPLTRIVCEAVTPFHGKVKKTDQATSVTLCNDEECTSCGPYSAPLDPALADYVVDGACLRALHQGVWVEDDPEAPLGCKTTGLALYDDSSIYPRYVASSRVVEAPGFIDPAVRLDVTRGGGETCACAADDCCHEGQAAIVRLAFAHDGAPVAELGPGAFADVTLAGATYVVGVLRSHVKGQVGLAGDTCVSDPETHFIDWHMLRLLGP